MISANIALGNVVPQWTINNTGGVPFGAVFSGVISDGNAATYNSGQTVSFDNGCVGFWKVGAGTLLLTGTNTYTGDTIINGGNIAIGSNQALGTGGSLYVASGFGLMGIDAGQVITNPLVVTGTMYFGGATGGSGNASSGSLTFTGPVTMMATTTFQVNDPMLVDFAGGLGESYGSSGLTKTGPGILLLSAENTYSGATAVNAGTLMLNNDGRVMNTTGITVAQGATFEVDDGNSLGAANNVTNRIGDTTNITLTGGTAAFFGDPGAASTETFGSLVLTGQTSSTFVAAVDAYDGGTLALLSTGTLTHNTGATIQFVSQGADLGSACSSLRFAGNPTSLGSGGNGTTGNQGNSIVPFASILMAGTTTPDPFFGCQATSPVWNFVAGNMATITAFTNYYTSACGPQRGAGRPRVPAGSFAGQRHAGLERQRDAQRPFDPRRQRRHQRHGHGLLDGQQRGRPGHGRQQRTGSGQPGFRRRDLSHHAHPGHRFRRCLSLPRRTIVSATGVVDKAGYGTLELTGVNNTYTTATNVDQGILRINNAAGNGSAGNNVRAGTGAAANLTIVANGSLELAGGACLTQLITVNGFGFANEGAIRTAIGDTSTNTLNGNVTMGSNTDFRVDAGGRLVVNACVSGTADLNKFGFGTMTLGGGAVANTYAGNTVLWEGTLVLDKNNNVQATGYGSNVFVGDALNGPNSACLVLEAPTRFSRATRPLR